MPRNHRVNMAERESVENSTLHLQKENVLQNPCLEPKKKPNNNDKMQYVSNENEVQKVNQNLVDVSDNYNEDNVNGRKSKADLNHFSCTHGAKLECSGNNENNDSFSTMYYGVCLPSGSSCTDDEEMPLIFTDKKEALRAVKKYKGARFKSFHKKEEAMAFANQSPEQLCATPPAKSISGSQGSLETELNQGEKTSPFKAPRSQDLVKLRKFIESGDVESFKQTVWSNPRYLVSSGDTPAVLQEGFRYNALHVAAKCKQAAMCQIILDIIEDMKFMELLYSDDSDAIRQQRINFLTDLYINTPDKGLCETPLHFASKFGSAKVVEILLAHPACDRNRANKYGRTPRDMICERCPDGGIELKKQIDTLFDERLYVPLLRSENHSAPPVIGKPWSPEKDSSLESLPLSSPRSPCEPQLAIKALAGPMSPKQAEDFYKQWKIPPIGQKNKMQARLLHRMRLADTEKGLERAGRELARQLKVPWSEYWEFLNCWCDLASSSGLCKLENHLKNMHNKVMFEQAAQEAVQKKSTNKFNETLVSPILPVPSECIPLANGSTGSSTSSSASPMSQLCKKLENFHMQNSDSVLSPVTPASHCIIKNDANSERKESKNLIDSLNYASPRIGHKNDSFEGSKVKDSKPDKNLIHILSCANSTKNCFNEHHGVETNSANQINMKLLGDMLSHNLTTAIFEVASILHEDVKQEANIYRLLIERSLPYLPTSFMQLTSNTLCLQSLHINVGMQLYEAFNSTLQLDEIMQLYRCLRIPLGSENDTLLSSDDEEEEDYNPKKYHSFPSQRHHYSNMSLAKQHLKCIFRIMCFHMCKSINNTDSDKFANTCSCKLLLDLPVLNTSRDHLLPSNTNKGINSVALAKGDSAGGKTPAEDKQVKLRPKHKHANGDADCHLLRSPLAGNKCRTRISKRNGSGKTNSLTDLSNDDVLTENEESDSDDVFVTPPSSAGSTRSSTPQEAQTPEEGAEVFIQGSYRSKVDLDVFRAIEGVYIDSVLYPHILRWKHLVGTYSKEDIESWPTPSCLRRQSSASSPSMSNHQTPSCFNISTPLSLQHHYINARSSTSNPSIEPRNLYESFLNCEEGGGDR